VVLAAQSTGVTTADLKGLVRLKDGAPMAGVVVTLHRADLNGTWTTTSDRDGRYRFRLLPAEKFFIRAQVKPEHAAQAPVTLQVGSTAQQDLMFTLAIADRVVVVVAPILCYAVLPIGDLAMGYPEATKVIAPFSMGIAVIAALMRMGKPADAAPEQVE